MTSRPRATPRLAPAGALQKAGKLPNVPKLQSGSFTVADQAIVAGGETEPGTSKPARPAGNSLSAKDQVIADDLIVQGSECVGQDCVNNENFGFDTLRLKENNTRIKFEDTSNSGSFPTTDWQLTANDSTNGGADYFSIDDITDGKTPFKVLGNAPTNSIYVNSSGNVGLGTSSPVVELHIADGDTPTLRLEQNNSSGFAAQTWDVAGNETNFFVRDTTNGSKIPFKIIPGAPTNSLYVNNAGNIGVGTASPEREAPRREDYGQRRAILMQDTTDNSNDKPGLVLAPRALGQRRRLAVSRPTTRATSRSTRCRAPEPSSSSPTRRATDQSEAGHALGRRPDGQRSVLQSVVADLKEGLRAGRHPQTVAGQGDGPADDYLELQEGRPGPPPHGPDAPRTSSPPSGWAPTANWRGPHLHPRSTSRVETMSGDPGAAA